MRQRAWGHRDIDDELISSIRDYAKSMKRMFDVIFADGKRIEVIANSQGSISKEQSNEMETILNGMNVMNKGYKEIIDIYRHVWCVAPQLKQVWAHKTEK